MQEDIFASELNDVQTRTPRPRIKLRPVMKGRRINFELVNEGNLTIELIEIKAMAPVDILDDHTGFPSAQTHILNSKKEDVDGRPFQVIRLNTNSVNRSRTGIEPLPMSFSPGMSPLELRHFAFTLKHDVPQREPGQKITTTISLKRYPAIVREIPITELAQTDSPK